MRLLNRLTRRARPAEPAADDHHAPTMTRTDPGEYVRLIPAPRAPSEPSQRRAPTPPPAPPAAVVRRPAAARHDLLEVLGCQLKADQALWAPHLLTSAELRLAAPILRRYHRG